MSIPCSKGLFPTADHPDTSIVIGKAIGHAIGHAYGDMPWANGDMAPAFSGEIVDVSYVALGADGSPLATAPAPTALPSGDTTVNSTNGTCFIESYVYNQSSAPTPAPTPVPTPPPMQTTTTTTTATATATVYTGIQALAVPWVMTINGTGAIGILVFAISRC